MLIEDNLIWMGFLMLNICLDIKIIY